MLFFISSGFLTKKSKWFLQPNNFIVYFLQFLQPRSNNPINFNKVLEKLRVRMIQLTQTLGNEIQILLLLNPTKIESSIVCDELSNSFALSKVYHAAKKVQESRPIAQCPGCLAYEGFYWVRPSIESRIEWVAIDQLWHDSNSYFLQ